VSAAAPVSPATRAELLDRLVRLCLPSQSSRSAPASSAPLAALYAAARRRTRAPLAAGAARALCLAVHAGDLVLLTTGLVTAAIPAGETDGPPGALVLARALIRGRGARAILLTEPAVVRPTQAAAEALAAGERDGESWRGRLQVQPFPSDPAEAAAAARRLWQAAKPAALISVEKLGPNRRGVIHTMYGEDVTATQARTDRIFALARRHGVLTVGIGDRGNEIGMGGLLSPRLRCACPCRGTIACAVPADRPVVAFSSNWGSYAVAAALAARLRQPELLHRPASEGRMLRSLLRSGVVDGLTRRAALSVDGAPLAVQTALVDLLGAVLRPARA
jgi:D-glutamate cyclase